MIQPQILCVVIQVALHDIHDAAVPSCNLFASSLEAFAVRRIWSTTMIRVGPNAACQSFKTPSKNVPHRLRRFSCHQVFKYSIQVEHRILAGRSAQKGAEAVQVKHLAPSFANACHWCSIPMHTQRHRQFAPQWITCQWIAHKKRAACLTSPKLCDLTWLPRELRSKFRRVAMEHDAENFMRQQHLLWLDRHNKSAQRRLHRQHETESCSCQFGVRQLVLQVAERIAF